MKLYHMIKEEIEENGILGLSQAVAQRIRRIANQLPRQIERSIYTRFGEYSSNPEGIDIFEEEWDTLIILDAARHDFFQEKIASCGSKISKGGATPEWVRANFSDRELHDTVYITANAQYYDAKDEINCEFHAVHQILSPKRENPDISWLDAQEYNISEVTKKATQCLEEYPHKRLLVHYPAPHTPFIGETARKHLNEKPKTGYKPSGVPQNIVRKAYEESLNIVYDEATTVADSAEGKVVVSADHGEMLGERHTFIKLSDYGHFAGVYNDYLVTVPWYVYKNQTRKKIIPEAPQEQIEVDSEQIEQNLKHLGYL